MPVKKKTYILDTNILLTAPYSVYSFDEHNVSIADITLEELDAFKSAPGQKGVNAREVIRILDKMREDGNLSNGVQMPMGGGIFKIETNHLKSELPNSWDQNKPDNRILRVCKGIKDDDGDPILVSNDINMRIKADIIGVKAESYRTDQMSKLDEQYTGRCDVTVSSASIDSFYNKGELDVKKVILTNGKKEKYDFTENEFVLLIDETNEKHTALARYTKGIFVNLVFSETNPFGVTPRNIGQKFAQEALLTDVSSAPLVILKGPAGTAKTFYALAAGLEKTIGKSRDTGFSRILVARPNIKFDEDIGFLKGTEEEKIGPLIRPIYDNLEQLTKTSSPINKDGYNTNSYAQDLFDRGIITAQALAYMRGRSITDTWIIIDEAQNMSPIQAFGIISRCGAGSKVVLVGDPEQIDNPHLDSRTNGLSYAAERMKGSPLCWQMTFSGKECVRSPLALEAIKRLSPKGFDK